MGSFRHRGLASIVFNEHLTGGGRINMTVVCNIAQSVVGQ